MAVCLKPEHPTPAAGDLSYVEDTHDIVYYDGTTRRHNGTPAGSVEMFAGSSVPVGWLLCNGAAVSRTTYAGLFAAVGTTWGSSDGSTTFNVPNMVDRYPRGAGATALGGSVGADTLPNHAHTVDPPSTNSATGDPDVQVPAGIGAPFNVSSFSHTHATNIA